jgi:hypothetical protein
MKTQFYLVALILLVFGFGCGHTSKYEIEKATSTGSAEKNKKVDYDVDTSFKTIHIFVALCDNKFQGIVPVPET